MLIQPILAYGDGTPDYTIFTGFYDWHDGNWVQSQVAPVKPGDVVYGNVRYSSRQLARRASGVCTSARSRCNLSPLLLHPDATP